MKQENLFDTEDENKASGPVECLGMTFESDEARRTHFIEQLREKLKDPEFRSLDGFPKGADNAILELSDPPYYTACPNPWFSEVVDEWEKMSGKSSSVYHREPYAADVSEGKNDPIYNAHSYHTKVPHKAIMRYILHYTEPGDVVLDGFCGSGMTGVAAQMCGDVQQIESLGYQVDANGNILERSDALDSSGREQWTKISKVGVRKVILNDLSPLATYLSSNFNTYEDVEELESKANEIISSLEEEFSWLYKTKHGEKYGRINYTIWSDVFECPECLSEIVFWDSAVDLTKGQVYDEFHCKKCSSLVTKRTANRVYITKHDSILNKASKMIKQVPVQIIYSVDGIKGRLSKKPDQEDLEQINKIESLEIDSWFPSERLFYGRETRRNDAIGFTHIHHYYTKRNLLLLSSLYKKLKTNKLKFLFTGFVGGATKLNQFHLKNYVFGGGGINPGARKGTLYAPSISMEVPIFSLYRDRLRTQIRAFKNYTKLDKKNCLITTSSCSALNSGYEKEILDYVFIDPPFGANLNYSELSVFWESWLGLYTKNDLEAIENPAQNKGPDEYRGLMTSCFRRIYELLKPGRWITIEFSNTKASVWNNIQSSLSDAGFIVGNVSALDKKQGGINANVTKTAVKQDLVISAYKPSADLELKFNNGNDNSISLWEFVSSHLSFVPIFKLQNNRLVPVSERDPRILFDRVVSFFVRKSLAVPISSQDFQLGLRTRYAERDGMFFLPEQVAEYDKKRAQSSELSQLSIFVDDEASAIEWMRKELKARPKVYSEIHPLFLNELSGWKKNELELELSTLLEQNFLKYDGNDEVPSQIHTYLSTNFKDMRGLDKSDPKLVAKAKERWYVPDPNKAADLEKVRLRALLKEFEMYKAEKKKIKQPRAEALRAGFNTAWEAQDFQTILDISAKIPPAVLQEDEKLLMFYDNALTLTSSEDDEW